MPDPVGLWHLGGMLDKIRTEKLDWVLGWGIISGFNFVSQTLDQVLLN